MPEPHIAGSVAIPTYIMDHSQWGQRCRDIGFTQCTEVCLVPWDDFHSGSDFRGELPTFNGVTISFSASVQ